MILDIDPKVDYAFKYLLGRDATRPILINVIESVLDPALKWTPLSRPKKCFP